MKVVDSFLFFNEKDLLKVRLNILKEQVDVFVITESTVTFSGKEKKLIFPEVASELRDFPIVYNVVVDTPMNTDSWGREIYQRNAMKKILAGICSSDTMVITGDLDEIPNLTNVLFQYKPGTLFHPLMDMYYYYFNLFKETDWYGSKVCSWDFMKNISVDDLRNMKTVGEKIKNSGWHFSFMGGEETIREKLGAFSHTEYDNDFIKGNIRSNMENQSDLFFRGGSLKKVPIDSRFPKYIQDNQEKLSKFIRE